jgi:ferredoxin
MRLEVNPIKCEAHGLCAELLPEHVRLDEWGYPLIESAPIPAGLVDLARRAADVCPTLAIRLRAAERSMSPGRELRDQHHR